MRIAEGDNASELDKAHSRYYRKQQAPPSKQPSGAFAPYMERCFYFTLNLTVTTLANLP